MTSAEVLEPKRTLQERLRFVSPTKEPCASDSTDNLSNLIGQLASLAEQQGNRPEPKSSREPWQLCTKPDSCKKIYMVEEDGWQIVDEYGEKADVPSASPSPQSDVFDPSSQTIAPSEDTPIFTRQDTVYHFQWRIANLPYPESVYNIAVDDRKQQIVVRTNNRKYFKRIDVPEITDMGLYLNAKSLTWECQRSTLVVSYARPSKGDLDNGPSHP